MMDNRDREDKRRLEEYKKNPMINLADSINRSMTGDLKEFGKGSFLITIIIVLIIVALYFLFRSSN